MVFETPEQAEVAFYQALADGDPAAMTSLWEESDAVACIHPVGPRLSGHTQVTVSWEHILEGGGMRLRQRRLSVYADAQLAVHTVLEELLRSDGEGMVEVLATNVYRRGPHGWRMVLHHASPVAYPETSAEGDARQVH